MSGTQSELILTAVQVQRGIWYDSKDSNGFERRSSVTQYHDVIGFVLGKWIALFAQVITALSILGTAIAQIVASSSSQHSIDTKYDKR